MRRNLRIAIHHSSFHCQLLNDDADEAAAAAAAPAIDKAKGIECKYLNR